ncbi:DUF2442 domain-containing protein [Thiocapsa bogorovii]|uniref:DUF2442 domain-containing protein n=1 Tax=Thiocapsa bogorovii TaxID=521689 RepID=UPI001E57F1FB|nr:DUF2442 domain-containing protein [Thiocapsa bogorovii]UHD17841.1 DUF2442 domain-containing protein [Thiocapsa bogorovii]
MPIEAASETDRAIGVIPASPWRVKGLSILPDYRRAVTFQDGTSGVADLSAFTSAHDRGIYEPLNDPSYFKQARLEMGVVTWPNGADLNPAWMYEELTRLKTWPASF